MNCIIKLYIQKRAKEQKIKIPVNYEKRVKQIISDINSPVKIYCSISKNNEKHIPKASIPFFVYSDR